MPVTTTAAALEAVRAFFAVRVSVDRAQVGEPDSPGSLGITIVACSVLDGPVVRDSFKRRDTLQNILALWLRGVQQDEEAVELALAAFKDDVLDAFPVARLSGDLRGARLEDTYAGLPDYQRRLSGEARAFPLVVAVPITRPLP